MQITRKLYALSLILCTFEPILANDPPGKSASKPVARLIATSENETPKRIRTRLEVPSETASPSTARSPSSSACAATDEELRAFVGINRERQTRALKPLILDEELCRLARLHSENMSRQGFFSHVGHDGLDTAERAAALGIRGWRALGENIAYNQGFDDPVKFAVARWMASTKHRHNILNAAFTHSGVGVSQSADGRVFFTQIFMTR